MPENSSVAMNGDNRLNDIVHLARLTLVPRCDDRGISRTSGASVPRLQRSSPPRNRTCRSSKNSCPFRQNGLPAPGCRREPASLSERSLQWILLFWGRFEKRVNLTDLI